MQSRILKRAVCIWTLFLFVGSTVFAKIPKAEKSALMDIYQSANGHEWIKPWDLSKSISTWHGVEIMNDHVVGIDLFNNNLSGQLPKSIGKLKRLRLLNVAFNELKGSIPTEITELTQLKELRLGKNGFKGVIPNDIDRLQFLEVLDLYGNNLSGALPSELGSLRKLRMLVLSNNSFEGVIPESFGDLTLLESLELGNNRIEGTLPERLGKLTNLNRLILFENNLSGAVPKEIFSLPKLKMLQLQNNNLEVDREIQKTIQNLNLAFLDMGYKSLQFENEMLLDLEIDGPTRMADTKFEDVD